MITKNDEKPIDLLVLLLGSRNIAALVSMTENC